MNKNIQVGDIVERKGKRARVQAVLPNDEYMVQYIQDENRSPNTIARRQYYKYRRSELYAKHTTVNMLYDIEIFDEYMAPLGKVTVEDFPNTDVLLNAVNEKRGTYAQIVRRYKAN